MWGRTGAASSCEPGSTSSRTCRSVALRFCYRRALSSWIREVALLFHFDLIMRLHQLEPRRSNDSMMCRWQAYAGLHTGRAWSLAVDLTRPARRALQLERTCRGRDTLTANLQQLHLAALLHCRISHKDEHACEAMLTNGAHNSHVARQASSSRDNFPAPTPSLHG